MFEIPENCSNGIRSPSRPTCGGKEGKGVRGGTSEGVATVTTQLSSWRSVVTHAGPPSPDSTKSLATYLRERHDWTSSVSYWTGNSSSFEERLSRHTGLALAWRKVFLDTSGQPCLFRDLTLSAIHERTPPPMRPCPVADTLHLHNSTSAIDRAVMASDAGTLWLGQLRDEPVSYVTVAVNSQATPFTVFGFPDILQTMSPGYHQRKELQLGLHNRTHQTSGTQLLKVDIAGLLHTRLVQSGLGSWQSFVTAVVGDVRTARGHYQNGADSDIPDEVVPYLLAMDALFLVVFFQFLNVETYFLDEFRHLGPRLADTARTLVRSDLLLLENQLPMYLLQNVVTQLVTVTSDPADPRPLETQVEDELDNVLKVAVRHLYPLGHPDVATGLCCGLHRGDALDMELGFHGYLDKKYPLEPLARSLQNCKHLLDCVYVVVCGHTLPYPDLAPDPNSAKLDSIPSVSRLQAIGISVTDRAPTLDRIGLRGCGYVTSARLSLPKVDVYDFTEMVFHNLAVHEQLVDGGRHGELRCFLQCMASLSNDAADVRLLLDHGVIDNKVGNNVVGMWERILKGVSTASPSESWLRCYHDIHNHRKSRVKRWRREVWVLFFSKPWTFVGLLGACAILFLTAVQTWFTVVNSASRSWRWPSGSS